VRFRKQREALHHVEEGVRQFVERELVGLLRESKSWGGLPIEAGGVVLCVNRIHVEIRCPERSPEALRLTFREQDGRMSACVDSPGWLAHLGADQRTALTVALAGLCKLGSVDAVGATHPEAADAFGTVLVSWDGWVETWEADQAGKELPTAWLAGIALLPVV
jgi:hypothetical protein